MSTERPENRKSITFGEIALALASDYESVYVINSEDDSYVEYIADGDNKTLVERYSGDDFYADTIKNCRLMVYPEDQEHFLNSFKKEYVIEVLKNGKSFNLNYRLVINGEPLHYFLKTIVGNDKNVIIGVQNIDEQRKRELAEDEERITYQHIAGALASRYEAIYYINIDDNSYTRYSASEEYAKLGTAVKGDDFFIDAAADGRKYIHPDDLEYMLFELDKNNLLRHLDESGMVSLSYRQLFRDGAQHVTMNIVHPKNDNQHIVIGVMNVDAQVMREQSMREESEMFAEVSLGLASRYEVIYRVNTVTNAYNEYTASDKYARLEVGTTGDDFFADTQRNMKRDIYPEDYPMMAQAMDKENLLRKLEGVGKIYLHYRLMLDGRPQYVSLVVIRSTQDSEHIIVAVENIDAAKRKELEFEAAIGSAIDMANKDALTGVKNKHAYVSAETQLDNQIEVDGDVEFAIAICDINGLKQVNDEQGHSAGDQFIKDACMMICHAFDHSPVFRIGGDEFVIILRGQDYENRADIIYSLAELQKENRKNGLVTIACGISDYEPLKDLNVQDVFERADVLMYENKKRFKSGAV